MFASIVGIMHGKIVTYRVVTSIQKWIQRPTGVSAKDQPLPLTTRRPLLVVNATAAAGQATLPEPPPGLVARSISPPGLPLAEALREAPQRLTAAVRELS